jgi:hypothetical protein
MAPLEQGPNLDQEPKVPGEFNQRSLKRKAHISALQASPQRIVYDGKPAEESIRFVMSIQPGSDLFHMYIKNGHLSRVARVVSGRYRSCRKHRGAVNVLLRIRENPDMESRLAAPETLPVLNQIKESP